MLVTIRKEIEASILAHQEAEDWSGELDHTAHIHSYQGVHNWRRDDAPRVDILYGFLNREIDDLGQDITDLPDAASVAVDAFGDAPSVDSLANAVALLRKASADSAASRSKQQTRQSRQRRLNKPNDLVAEFSHLRLPGGDSVEAETVEDPVEGPSWNEFRKSLAKILTQLSDEQCLVISYRPDNYYVQFAAQGNEMLMEATGNAYIEHRSAKLTPDDYQLMVTLGWQCPTSHSPTGHATEDGSTNFSANQTNPIDVESMAARAVETFRRVFAIIDPSDLCYSAFANDGADVVFPSLRIDRAGS